VGAATAAGARQVDSGHDHETTQTRFPQTQGMSHVTFTEPGELGIRFEEGELAKVIEVKPRSASERAGIQEGWLIERINGRSAHRRCRTFKEVAAALKDPSRPLHIQFALQSVGVERISALGGGWLFDVAVSLPDGRVEFVSVAQQDNVENAGDFKRLILEQHGAAHLPAHAIQLMLVRQLSDGGLRGATWTGEKQEPVRNNMSIESLRKRLDGRIESLRTYVEAPHVWSAKLTECSEHTTLGRHLAGAHSPNAAQHQVVSITKPTLADDDAFELHFEDDVHFGA